MKIYKVYEYGIFKKNINFNGLVNLILENSGSVESCLEILKERKRANF